MAEVFGIVTGAISIAALFNNCVDCFEYIQIARSFGDDFSTYQLRLDVAKCRLSRWGAAVNVNNDPRFLKDASADPTMALAQDVLEQIVAKFKTAQKASLMYKTTAKDKDMQVCSKEDLGKVSQRLHHHLRSLTLKRQNRVGLTKKAYWAIYDNKKMARMIEDIFTLMNDLEEVFPATPQATTRLVEMEIEEVSDAQELKMIQDVAKGLDPVLEGSSKGKLEKVIANNSAGRINGTSAVNIGHTYVKESFLQSKGSRDTSTNHVGEINGGKHTRVNVGNTYGGKGFWD
ncbi:hypothetical protein FPOAC2_04232 [Fusarium poae]|uniref:Prion-inhibition and propagation HeLo domain-containing protein n=1 Tax=Fusarium poae TaxID=36050 RepID=A0A1B8AS96_FUSPO|nr:hypothetical protein FPOA_03777 [Fusarium poae]